MLNWAIIGCGDVVQRLVQDSLFVRGKSNVIYVISDNVTGQQFRFEVESIDAEPTITPFTGELVSSNVTNVTTSTAPKEVSFQFIYTLGSY